MNKNFSFLVITGGAGFIGSNLVKFLLKKTNYNLISIDNYFTGNKNNHIKNSRIKYINGETKNISEILKNYKKIKCIFHFGEFSRINKSFYYSDQLKESNIIGTFEVINFCKKNKIEIIYSATSAAFGNNFENQNLSPYAFTKNTNLNLIMNYNIWFELKYKVVYFYNVYGSNEIENFDMGAVIGIFKKAKKMNLPLSVVKPGTQSRHFTNIIDTIEAVYEAFLNKNYNHFAIRSKKKYSILQIAKLFKHKYKFVNERKGERFESKSIKSIRGNKVINFIGKLDLKDYIKKIS
jgi:UDP-glucose 4-epimerase